MLYYLAYGSNLHPLRLSERVPSARLVEVVTLSGYWLAFHKRGMDGSGKCNLHPAVDGQVHGALYRLAADEKPMLDRYEGSGYEAAELELMLGGEPIRSFLYLARETHVEEQLQPYHWYKELVLTGAQYLRLPPSYVAQLTQVESCPDPDQQRRLQHEQLLQRLRAVPPLTR